MSRRRDANASPRRMDAEVNVLDTLSDDARAFAGALERAQDVQ